MSSFFLCFRAHANLYATAIQIKNEAYHVYKNTQAKQNPKQNRTPCADALPWLTPSSTLKWFFSSSLVHIRNLKLGKKKKKTVEGKNPTIDNL